MREDKIKVLYIGPVEGFDAAISVLTETFNIVHIPATIERFRSELNNCRAILDASMKLKITSMDIRNAPHLKIISCATTGADHIDNNELERRGIALRTLKEDREFLKNITPAAELSWALLMACARRLVPAVGHVRSGGWNRELFPGTMLRGKRLGLVGCGRIGTWMSRYADAFGMECFGYDPYLEVFPKTIVPKPLEEIFSSSDFISLHVHLTDETRGMIGRRYFEIIKPGAVIINTSRGGVIDEKAMISAMEFGKVAAAGMDVLSNEPDIQESALWNYSLNNENLIITPHCGGYSPDAVALVTKHAALKIRGYF